jgi:outer membrane lipoprotein-sorting protein
MKAGRLILIVLLASALAAAGVLTYRRWPGFKNSIRPEAAKSSNPNQLSSVPPFASKEPDRYQATRIITNFENGAEQVPPGVTRILIAKDGDRRREDYETDTNFSTSYLEIAAGTFILLPSKKLYADIKSAPEIAFPNQREAQVDDTDAEFSADRLLNETPGVARYEKLGSEKLEGRETTKYRVTNGLATNGTEPPTVAFIWIDETLGMPVRSETEGFESNHHSKQTIELVDIRQQVDPGLFELPKDYKRVGYSQVANELKQAREVRSKESPGP